MTARAAPSHYAQRLAKHRAEMQLALSEGLTLDEARRRLAEARCRRTARCGTHADAEPVQAPAAQPPIRSWMDRYDNY